MSFDREGRFKATMIEQSIVEKDSGVVQLAAKFAVFQLLVDGAWIDIPQQDEFGYFNLILTDGSPADRNIENLCAAIGWNGHDLAQLQGTDWSQRPVQLTVKHKPARTVGDKTYEARFEIAFINPEDWEGAKLEKLPEAGIKALTAKFGGKLRAKFGNRGTAATKPAPRPAAPPAADPVEEAPMIDEPGASDPELEAAQAGVPAPMPARTAPPPRRPAPAAPKAY